MPIKALTNLAPETLRSLISTRTNMSRIKNKNTPLGMIVRSSVHRMGYRFSLHRKSLPGKPDFVIQPSKAVVFVHGCFWHNHPNCKRAKLPKTNKRFWKKKVEGNRKRDTRDVRLLRKNGWHVVTIWQCNLRNQQQVLKRLKRMVTIKHG